MSDVEKGLSLGQDALTLSGLTGSYAGAEAGAEAASAAAEGIGGAGSAAAGISSILGPIGILGAFYGLASEFGYLTGGEREDQINTQHALATTSHEFSVPENNLLPFENEVGAALENGTPAYGLKSDLSNISSVLPYYQNSTPGIDPGSYGDAGEVGLFDLLAQNKALDVQQIADNPQSFFPSSDYVPGNMGQRGDIDTYSNLPLNVPPYLAQFWSEYQANGINPTSFQPGGEWYPWLQSYEAQYPQQSSQAATPSTSSTPASPAAAPTPTPAANPAQGGGTSTPSNIAALKDPSLVALLQNYGLNT